MPRDAAGIVRVRQATLNDVVPMCEILNTIIAIGSMTAFMQPFSIEEFRSYFLDGALSLICVVAMDGSDVPVGFQALGRYPDLPDDWADIATFTRLEPRLPGVGTALFAATRDRATELGLVAINAAIRSDNARALAYYGKLGFETYRVIDGVSSPGQLKVDRILKQYRVR